MKKILLLSVLCLVFFTCAAVFADDLTDVMAAGELRFGCAREYLPFVFYDQTGTLTGIDIALIEEAGRRMGLSVRTIDIAFDGLIDSLNLGQTDVIGGAFSRTEARQQEIDFTRVYYHGDAQFIGLASLKMPETINYESFRDLKIGVQKGTSFDQWVKTNLISAGYVSARNVFIYPSAAAEMKALDRGDIDLTILDQDIYEDVYRSSGKYKVFYKGFAREDYAFGLRKGSTLTAELSKHLAEMIKDGTAQKIADRFFSMNYQEAEASIARPSQLLTPVPAVRSTSVPTQVPVMNLPTQVPSLVDYMTFVSDVTITDGHQVKPGERFRKTWRIKNTGTTTWTPQYSIVFVSGDRMNGQNVSVPYYVSPGQTVDLSVDLTAPTQNGTWRGYWQMRTPYGQNFGETIWVKVRVKEGK